HFACARRGDVCAPSALMQDERVRRAAAAVATGDEGQRLSFQPPNQGADDSRSGREPLGYGRRSPCSWHQPLISIGSTNGAFARVRSPIRGCERTDRGGTQLEAEPF